MKSSSLKTLMTFGLGLPAAFGAGWWLRAAQPVSAGKEGMATGQARTVLISGAQAPALVKPNLPFPGPAPLLIKPLTSLQEILAMLGPDGSIEDEAGAGIAMMELMPRLMITDVATVQAMLEELSGTEGLNRQGRKILTMGLMFRWMTVQPESAIGYSLAHPAMLEDSKEMNMLGLIYMAKARPEAAKGLAALMPEDERGDINKFLAKLEATSNPGGVLQDPLKRQGMSKDDQGKLAARWMKTDPAAAMAWLQALPEDQRSPDITARIAAARMQQDAAATLAWIGALPEGPEKSTSRARIIESVFTGVKDPEVFEVKRASLPLAWHDGARLQWMADNTPKDVAGSADQLKLMFTRNPDLANDPPAKRAVHGLAASFGKSGDFNGGAAWAMTLPEGPAQAGAATTIAQQWTGKDPGAASTWITGLPEGPTRDAAASGMINQIQQEDPASALVWAQSLSNVEKRHEQTRGVFQAWFRNEPLQALNAIQTMPPGEQELIFKTQRKGYVLPRR